ncbi:LysR family transcriptional regulator [Jannaschia marina]|uniref:LysR family transcriptional regulator n=1 Tax=Jannaschia marina TaxID=2741674 RepID=UPI0015CEAB6F|nr:LysR family transcriptional regulator [Jannaschia marina]
MNLIQLRAFREVMATGSISRAARTLGRTQPSVSAAIAKLEASYGMPLFERTGRRLVPVPEARHLDGELREILARLDRLDRDMKRMREREVGTLTVASMPGPAVWMVPGLLARFGADRPDARMRLISRQSETVVREVAAGQADIGLCDASAIAAAGQLPVAAELMRLECLCALPASAPEAACTSIGPEQLAERPVAHLIGEHDTTRHLMQLMSDAGARLNTRFEAQMFLPLLRFAQQGLAFAVVDPVARHSWRELNGGDGGLNFRPLKPPIAFDVALIVHRNTPLSQLAVSFRGALKDAFETYLGRRDED